MKFIYLFILLGFSTAMMSQDFSKEWSEVDALMEKQLPKSAYEKANAIFQKSIQSNNQEQIVKSIFYLQSLSSQLEEIEYDSRIQKEIKYIESNMVKVKGGAHSIVLSFLASKYDYFLTQNYYKIQQRTAVSNTKDTPEDIALWSIKELTEKSRALYLLSCQDKSNRSISLSAYKNLISNSDSKYCKTLYDFLVRRAIEGLSDDRVYLHEPANVFEIEQKQFQSLQFPYEIHLKLKNTTSDKAHVIGLYESLIKDHQSDTDQMVLIDLELNYLEFIYSHYQGTDRSQIYKKHLLSIFKKYQSNRESYYALLTVARLEQEASYPYTSVHDSSSQWKLRDAVAIYNEIISNCKDENIVHQALNNRNAIVENIQASIEMEKVYIPQTPILAKWNYTNWDQVYFRIYPRTKDIHDRELYQNDQSTIFKKIMSRKLMKEGQFQLKNPHDFQGHSTELNLPPLEKGSYIVVFSRLPNFSLENNYMTGISFAVSNLAYFTHQDQSQNIQDIYVVDRTTGRPLSNVQVEMYQNDYQGYQLEAKLVHNVQTNSQGKAPLGLQNKNVFFKLRSENDELLEKQEVYLSQSQSIPQENTSTQYQLFLDRAVYRPSQTIYFKGIAYLQAEHSGSKILPNTKVSVQFLDVNSQLIETKSFTTNEYGTFHGTFTAPKGGLLGNMSIRVEQSYVISVRVEEYKRPSFEVIWDTFRQSARLGDTIYLKGIGKSYSGANVSHARVRYNVLRRTSYPFWKCWWMPLPSDEYQVAQGEAKTDANGQFELSFIAEAGEPSPWDPNPVYRYEVKVDMIDVTGETQFGSTTIALGKVDFEMRVEMKETYTLGEMAEMSMDILNLNGVKIDKKVEVDLVRLKQPDVLFQKRYWEKPDLPIMTKDEFQSKFPYMAYRDEDRIENYEVASMMDIRAQDNSGVYKFYFDKAGAYRVAISAEDNMGQVHTIYKYVTVTDEKSPSVSKPISILNLKSTYEPNQNIDIQILSTQSNQRIWYSLIRKNTPTTGLWTQQPQTRVQTVISEQDRGGAYLQWTTIYQNRWYSGVEFIPVPWKNKELETEYLSFRDKLLPGQQEEWRIKIKGKNGDKVMAEVLANMYDQSLDIFQKNEYHFFPFQTFSLKSAISSFAFQPIGAEYYLSSLSHTSYHHFQSKIYPSLIWQENFYGGYRYRMARRGGFAEPAMAEMKMAAMSEDDASAAAPQMLNKAIAVHEPPNSLSNKEEKKPITDKKKESTPPITIRTNLNETVFFKPNLLTDENGNVIISFQMNEALTKWKFMTWAVTKDLQIGMSEKSVVTQKELMIQPNSPRFVRENDEVYFTAKVTNLSSKKMAGVATLECFDPIHHKAITQDLKLISTQRPFDIEPGQTKSVEWKIVIPENLSALQYRVIAKSGNFSDGEENTIPVLTDKLLVTETLPFQMKSNSKKSFVWKEMVDKMNSPSLKSKLYKIEYAANPMWYAIQSLPYLMEFPYECSEQIFNRFFANALSGHIISKFPKIKTVFESWKGTDAMQSNLTKNQNLKSALLEETPWVLEVQSEEELRKNIATLFDVFRLESEQQSALLKLEERQAADGSFPWFPGSQSNPYITQYIVEGLGHLKYLGVEQVDQQEKATIILNRGIDYIDQYIVQHYKDMEASIKKYGGNLQDDHLDPFAIHYLYTRSFFDKALPKETQKVLAYYHRQGMTYWTKKSLYEEGMLALYFHRSKDKEAFVKNIDKKASTTVINDMMKSFRERAKVNEEKGMYWDLSSGYWWYQLPIETHSLMTEVFEYLSDNPAEKDNLKLWLLKNKQTNRWETTKSTASAIYALLGGKNDRLHVPLYPKIKVAGTMIDVPFENIEKGTGYMQKTWQGDEMTPQMAQIEVENPNPNIGWGAIYWQYVEKMNAIQSNQSTPLKVSKKIYIVRPSSQGETMEEATAENIKIGDKLRVRLILYAEREMEFLHLKDMRAAGLEPRDAISGYKWSGGLGYYQTTRDASMNFFIDYIQKGTYTLEYDLVTNLKGTYSSGIATFQSMYAPEFNSHSQGVELKIK